ncbi:MAG TPA: c-type cytochrome, partial [Ottowia sp.]|uniref:c-type cytochrome n=1 Tax=Ottowia sp. TaxID=1898956 RepID=UPI002BB9AA40
MKTTLSPMFAAIVVALGAAMPAQAQVTGDAKAGEGKIAMCIGCHGIIGYKSSFPEVYHVPKISGQNAKYIAAALEAYKKGDRKHPSMRGIATTMSEQDIADVAAYYA